MPKELTHFTIADKAYELMDESWLKNSIKNYKELYYIASVAFDSPYYLNGKYSPVFQQLADKLHGTRGENTFQPINSLFHFYKNEMPDYSLAFIAGLLTHIIIDSEFHPLVYFLTGDYHDPNPARRIRAVSSHRKWEAKLDIHLTRNFQDMEPLHLTRCLKNKGISDEELLNVLEIVYFGQKGHQQDQTRKALYSQAKITRRLNNRSLFQILRAANFMVQGLLYPTLALFYPSVEDRAYFEQSFSYYHPVDGQIHTENILAIERRAIDRILSIFAKWIQCASWTELAELIACDKGPSLETGL